MKDSKFIELLNLYLDQQIDPADAARLEDEIARSPARRATYQQYCRMHRACTMLFEQSHPAAEVGVKLATAAAAADEKIEAFPASGPGFAWLRYGAALTVAACVAFVFLNRPTNVGAPKIPAAVAQVTPAAAPRPVPAAAPAAPTVTPGQMIAHSDIHLAPNGVKVEAVADETPSLDWMRQVKFVPVSHVSASELVFEPHPNIRKDSDQQVFESRLPFQGKVEQASFQFQR
jgi:hypothetical protein